MKNTPASPEYTRVAECLYRSDASGIYYALLKKGGKQIRRSLKTVDRKLAERRLADFREQVGRLESRRDSSRLTFDEVATRWLNTWRGHLKASSVRDRAVNLRQLSTVFGGSPVRGITRAHCEAWAERRSPQVSAST